VAISIVAAAFVATACSGLAATPSAAQFAASRPSASPTTAVLPSPMPSPTTSPAALPDGRLVFERLVGDVGSLFTMNPDGTGTKPLLPSGESPRWSPDGRHISVVANNPQGRLFVGLVDPDGSQYVQFHSPDPKLDLGCFAWSPDASRLACEGWDDTNLTRNGLYTVRASDGGDLVRVTTCPKACHDVPTDYSPDGHQIVFTRQKLPDEADVTLMVVNVDGSNARALSDQKIGGGRWSPDGKTILAGANGSLLLLPIDGSAMRTVEVASDATLNPIDGAWSPNGEWIVFSGHSSTGFDLYIVRTDGTNLHQLTDTHGIWEGGADWAVTVP
jgi:Tol biopolymer transport system component